MKNKLRNALVFMGIDIVVIIMSYVASILVVKVIGGNTVFVNLPLALAIIVFGKIVFNYFTGIYNIIPRHIDLSDMVRIAFVSVFTNISLVLILLVPGVPVFMHKSIYVFITTFELIGLLTYRVIIKVIVYYISVAARNPYNSKVTLIIGAGSGGELAMRELIQNKDLNNYIVGFLDDDINKLGKTIANKPILGTIKDLHHFILEYNVEEVVLAINTYPISKINELLEVLSSYPEIKLKRISVISDLRSNETLRITDINVEDLLEREVIELDNQGLVGFVKDQTVLVTGGGGSIGSELCRQIFNLKPKKLVIFDIYENNAYEIQMELERLKYKDKSIQTELVVLIGSVYNEVRLEQVFSEHLPNIVFHAAAYKHVPLMEDSPVEAIRTNVLGTYNTALLADKYKVNKMVLVSSDKAVRSTNVMGATKRYAELIISYFNTKGNTNYSAVRFGNVLGSNGSVIPLFKKQIADGGPLTVTHKEITRYFMTIPEAVGLILQSAVYAKGGEIFILDMGEPVKIYDLAKKMIALSGLKPNIDIMIEVSGLRPGEKLYEELLVDKDNNDFLTTNHSRIFIEPVQDTDYSRLDLEYIKNNYEQLDNEHIKKMIAYVIDSYQIDGDKNVENS